MLGSICQEGSGNLLGFSRSGPPILTEQPTQQSWVPKFAQSPVSGCSNSKPISPYSGKDGSIEQETCNLDVQNHALFGANIDSSGLLMHTTMSGIGTSSVHADMSSMPLGASGHQSPLYGYVQDSSDVLHSIGQGDQPTPDHTFVKVYKTGSVGRSLDIGRFNSYHELRQELGQMFGIKGLLEDPQRSGWQLFHFKKLPVVELTILNSIHRAFVNNVWYIKILSPEDVLRLGKEEAESLSRSAVERIHNDNTQNPVCGLPSLGSLEY
ncbi:UNVERIFIED_CONTAM: Auxin response factor 12 [Sesamum angustifolium]|uniref:Auxin response factor 12 n=1 Tax=Sesamum angustifolium TaxID=2727405 RepID=A0AAW2RMD3_9LAMI